MWNDKRLAEEMNTLAEKNGWSVEPPFTKKNIQATLNSHNWVVASEFKDVKDSRLGIQVFEKPLLSNTGKNKWKGKGKGRDKA